MRGGWLIAIVRGVLQGLAGWLCGLTRYRFIVIKCTHFKHHLLVLMLFIYIHSPGVSPLATRSYSHEYIVV